MSNSRLDDPRHDITAMDLYLHRDLPVDVNGAELRRISDEVEDALNWLVALPDEEAFNSDLISITTALLGVQQYLQKLEDKFDAAGGARRRSADDHEGEPELQPGCRHRHGCVERAPWEVTP